MKCLATAAKAVVTVETTEDMATLGKCGALLYDEISHLSIKE